MAVAAPPPMTVERIVQMADARWGSPCGGNVSLTFSDFPPGTVGQAWPDECRVQISRALLGRKIYLCLVVLHEYGHVAGQVHSEDWLNIMYPSPSLSYAVLSAPECIPKRLRRVYVKMAQRA